MCVRKDKAKPSTVIYASLLKRKRIALYSVCLCVVVVCSCVCVCVSVFGGEWGGESKSERE